MNKRANSEVSPKKPTEQEQEQETSSNEQSQEGSCYIQQTIDIFAGIVASILINELD